MLFLIPLISLVRREGSAAAVYPAKLYYVSLYIGIRIIRINRGAWGSLGSSPDVAKLKVFVYLECRESLVTY